jgi:hypothetical protein
MRPNDLFDLWELRRILGSNTSRKWRILAGLGLHFINYVLIDLRKPRKSESQSGCSQCRSFILLAFRGLISRFMSLQLKSSSIGPDSTFFR